MSRTLSIILLLSLSASLTVAEQPEPVPAGQPDTTPTPRGITTAAKVHFPAPKVELPFRLESNKILVPVRINGKGPFDFVLDTGASNALFDHPSSVEDLELRYVGQAQVGGAGGGGNRTIDLAMGVTFDLGGVEIRDAILAVTPAEGPALMAASDWHGVFGNQVFSNMVVEIDWQAERLRLYDPETYRAPKGATTVPLRVGPHHVYVEAQIGVDKAPPKTVELVVDTGANHALSLSPSAGAPPAQRIEGTVLGYGLSGSIRGDIGRIRSLRLGETTFEGVVTSFPDPKLSGVIGGGSDGNLGAEIMRRFVTTFDYGNRRMLLSSTNDIDEPFTASTSGVYVRPWLDEEGHAVVIDVFAGSPAAQAGIREGDRIVAADGKPVAQLDLSGLRKHLRGKEGQSLELTITRGGERQIVSLVLQSLI